MARQREHRVEDLLIVLPNPLVARSGLQNVKVPHSRRNVRIVTRPHDLDVLVHELPASFEPKSSARFLRLEMLDAVTVCREETRGPRSLFGDGRAEKIAAVLQRLIDLVEYF